MHDAVRAGDAPSPRHGFRSRRLTQTRASFYVSPAKMQRGAQQRAIDARHPTASGFKSDPPGASADRRP